MTFQANVENLHAENLKRNESYFNHISTLLQQEGRGRGRRIIATRICHESMELVLNVLNRQNKYQFDRSVIGRVFNSSRYFSHRKVIGDLWTLARIVISTRLFAFSFVKGLVNLESTWLDRYRDFEEKFLRSIKSFTCVSINDFFLWSHFTPVSK